MHWCARCGSDRMAENEREAEEKMSDKEEIVFCKGGGCTAKLGPGILARVLEKIPKTRDENLMIGYDSSDDAAVYKLTDDLAVVQTLDFFPPMVDDPYTFGQIAAANALSDIYAMGGDVKTALNIVCFPENWDLNILGQIMLGGGEKVKEAGGVLAGGHSIADTDVKIAFSISFNMLFSHGWIWIIRASGTDTLAACWIGVGTP